MPPFILEKPNYENYFLLEGHFLGLRFDEGFVFARIIARERTNIKPYELGSVAAASAQSGYNAIKSSAGDYLLDPQNEGTINHFFVGVRPTAVRLYVNYPAGDALMSLKGARAVPGAMPTPAEESIGYIDGLESPFQEPSVLTEIFTVYQLYPEYRAYNPTNNAIPQVLLNIPITKYAYRLVTDQTMAKQFIDGVRRCRLYSVGGVVPAPMPQWLTRRSGVSEIASFTKDLVTQ